MANFVEAYNRSRFWHGSRGIHTIVQNGLLVAESSSTPFSSDPGGRGKNGIICLGTCFATSGDYGSLGNVARVFLGKDRAGELAGWATDGATKGSFKLGNDDIWVDSGAPSAVCTWADIGADCIWLGTLNDLCDRPPSDRKCVAIFGNIQSFDGDLPADVATLQGLMRQAVLNGELTDTVNETKCNPIWGEVEGPTTVAITATGNAGGRKPACCIIF